MTKNIQCIACQSEVYYYFINHLNHFKYDESHVKPSLYPVLAFTEHMKTSIVALAEGFYCFGSFPDVKWNGS